MTQTFHPNFQSIYIFDINRDIKLWYNLHRPRCIFLPTWKCGSSVGARHIFKHPLNQRMRVILALNSQSNDCKISLKDRRKQEKRYEKSLIHFWNRHQHSVLTVNFSGSKRVNLDSASSGLDHYKVSEHMTNAIISKLSRSKLMIPTN